MTRNNRSFAAVALTAVSLSAITTVHSLAVYLPTLNTPHTTLEGVPHPPSPIPPTPPLARRLAVIVLDGLSFDVARTLPALQPLRARGVFRSLAVEFPSFTSPAIVSFMTGLDPRDSGTRLNGNLGGVVGLDSVTRAAGDAHVPLAVWTHAYDDFRLQTEPPPGAPVYAGRFAVAADLVRRGLAGGEPPARRIDLIHWGHIDDAGHEHGAASADYAEKAEGGAAFVARYASSLDLDQDALVVLSDHGHLAIGGHGGDEPEVRHAMLLGVGRGFRRGAELPERPLRDVAATLAVVAGLRAPTSGLGRPMLDALTLDEAGAARALAAPFDQAARLLCTLHADPACAEAAPLAAGLRDGSAAVRAAAEQLQDRLNLARDQALEGRRRDGAHRRLAVAAALAAFALWGAFAALRRRGARLEPVALLLPILNVAVYVGVAWAAGYRPGFSFLRPAPELIADALPGGLLAAAVVTVVARRWRLSGTAPWVLLLGTAIPFALLAAWVGWDPATLPPSLAGAAVFQLGPEVLSAAIGAVLVALVAPRAARRPA